MSDIQARATKIKKQLLTKEEQEKLLLSFNDRYPVPQRNRTMIKLALRTGMRIDELLNLRWNDIRPNAYEDGTPYYKLELVHTKGGKPRNVSIWPRMDHELVSQFARFQKSSEYVFITHKGAKLTSAYCRQMIKKAAERAGIEKEKAHFHALRHTHLTELYKLNKDIVAVQKAAGHSSISTTQIYVHVADETVRDSQLALYPEDKE